MLHSPFHRCQEKCCALDTEQIHGKHGSGALLSPCFAYLLVVRDSRALETLGSGVRSDSVPEMEDALRALQQMVNALTNQNAALEAQLRGQQKIAKGLAELPGAITTMLNRAQATTRRMLVDTKGLGTPPVFSGREEDFYVWTNKVENFVSGVFPKVRGALAFAVESQDVVTATAVEVGVPELEDETSTERDRQLFIVLSALTDGESFDIVMSAGSDHGFESWRKLHRRWGPYTAGRARSLLKEILTPSQVKLPELHRKDVRSRETLLWSRGCSRKRAHSCEGHSHEFT